MNLVPHPETGVPSKEVISYESVELSQLEGAVSQCEAELGQAQAEVTRLGGELVTANETVSAKEVALAEAKSLVEQYNQLVPAPEPATDDAGTEGTGGEVEDGTEVSEVSEPVAVDVEVPQF